MKGIILSGGKGTRLLPLTKITSKQLLPVYNKQMIFYPLNTLIKAGIKDILVIVSPEYIDSYKSLLGNGNEYGVTITFAIQEKAGGLPEAFIIGETFIKGSSVTLILGDNIFENDLSEEIASFLSGASIFVKEVPDPERFGVVSFDENMKVTSIEEKPKIPKGRHASTGLYIFDKRVSDLAKELKPSQRGELEIVDLQNKYLEMDELSVRIFEGAWEDAGTFDSLMRASVLARDVLSKKF